VTRSAYLVSSIAFGMSISLAPLAFAAASNVQDAKKICLERYNIEKSSGTLPDGMAKSRYLRQCTTSIKRIAALESARTRTASSSGGATQGQK
jgi:hypothetical protein